MKLPKKVRRGEAVKAEVFNALIDYLKSITLLPGAGVRVRRTADGTTLGVVRGGEKHRKRGARMEVRDIAFNADTAAWECSVSPGWVLDTHLGNGKDDCALGAFPTIDGVGIDTVPAPRLELPDVASWIYLRIQTDSAGLRDVTAPTIVAKDAEEPSIHHIPDSDDGTEQDGDYYLLLARTESDGGTPPKPVLTGEGRQGDLYWPQILRKVMGEPAGVATFSGTPDVDSGDIDWDTEAWENHELYELEVDVTTDQDDDGVKVKGKVRVPLKAAGSEPFECAVVNNTTISVSAGEVWGFAGAHPAVSTNLSWSATNIGSLSGSGSVWLEVEGTKHNVIFYNLVGDLTDPIGLARYVPTSIIGLTASTPTAGTNWPGAGSTTGRFFIKLLDFTGGGSALAIAKRYVRDNIYISEFVIQADGEI